MQVDLSVIIPVYNCMAYLPACIDSIVAQEMDNIEVIVIDDGSTDGCTQWLEQKARIYAPLKVISQANKGVVEARNTGIAAAKGELIAFLDADDTWTEDKLSAQVNYMKRHQGCALTFTNYDHIDEAGNDIIDCFSYWKNPALNQSSTMQFVGLHDPLNVLLSANIVGTSTVIARKQSMIDVGLFDPTLNSASDWDMWLKLTQKGCFAYCSAPLMKYLMRQGSITANRLNRLSAMETIVSRVQDIASANALNIAQANIHEGYAEFNREHAQYLQAIVHDVKALYLSPHLRMFKHLCFDIKQVVIGKERKLWRV